MKGGFDANGDWHTNFMIYVVRGELRGSVIHDIVSENMGKSDQTTITKDKSVTYDYNRVPMDSPAEYRRRSANVDGKAVDFGNKLATQVIEDAATLKTVFFGDGTDFLNEDLFVAALIFLDRDFLLQEKGLLPETLSLVTDFSELRDQLIGIKNKCDLQQNLDRAKKVRETNQILQAEFGTCDVEKCIALLPRRTETVRQEIARLVHEKIISATADVLDHKLLSANIGWETFVSYRDAVKNKEAVGGKVTEDDRKKVMIAKNAMDQAARRRQQQSWPRWTLGAMLRKQFHGKLKAVPFVEPWLVLTYLDIEQSISDTRATGLFEDTFIMNVYDPLIKEVHSSSIKSTVELATDASFILHNSSFALPRKPSREILWEAKFFLMFYIAIWTLWGINTYYRYPESRKEDDGTIVPIPENVRWNKHAQLGTQMLVTTAGVVFEHKDITLAHFVLLAVVSGTGYIGGIGFNLLEKMRRQPTIDIGPDTPGGAQEEKKDGEQEEKKDDDDLANIILEQLANLPDIGQGRGGHGSRIRSGLMRPGRQLRGRHVP